LWVVFIIYLGFESAKALYLDFINSRAVLGSFPLWKGWQHFLYLLPLPQGHKEFIENFIL
jgi:hypothetical protein